MVWTQEVFGAAVPKQPFAVVQIGLVGLVVHALRPVAAQTRLPAVVVIVDGVERIVADLVEALRWLLELARPSVEQIA